MSVGLGLGPGTRHRMTLPAGLLAQSQSDRTVVEVREEKVPLLDLLRQFQGLQASH